MQLILETRTSNSLPSSALASCTRAMQKSTSLHLSQHICRPRSRRRAAEEPSGAAAVSTPGQQPEQQVQQQSDMRQQAPLPPYSQLSMPVYSLATIGPDGVSPTMNLVTFAAPISLQPRHYALGLYVNTLSWQNMLATRTGVLQILSKQHAALFEMLGRTSGRDVDKLAEIAARGFPVSTRAQDGIPLLGDSLGWMELRVATSPVNYGDHDVVICEVTAWHAPPAAAQGCSAAEPLYTGHLRELGLL